MGAAVTDKRIDALRADDGSIDGALAELSRKLAAWVLAMKKGQTALLGGTGETSSALGGSASPRRAAPGHSGSGRRAAAGGGSRLFQGQGAALVASGGGQLAPQAPAEDSGCAPAPAQDDEALLASLDTETARAIRVKRRLADNKRGVRELLEEMRSVRAPAGKTPLAGPRWWRRGDERTSG